MPCITIDARPLGETCGIYTALPCGGLESTLRQERGTGTARDPYRMTALIQNTGNRTWTGVIRFSLSLKGTNPRFFLPAFLYGRNRGEVERQPDSKLNPRLSADRNDVPYAPFVMTRADRLSHPAAILFCSGRILGISSSPYRISGENPFWEPGIPGDFQSFNGFFCSLAESSVGFTAGYEDAPYKYIDAQEIAPRSFIRDHCVAIPAGETLRVPLFVYDIAAEDERAITEILRDVYERYHQPPRQGAPLSDAIRDIASAIGEDAWLLEVKNYSTMIAMENGIPNPMPHTSIAWTGGAEVAAPLLMAAHRMGDEKLRHQALSCIDNIVQHSLNPDSGLPYETNTGGVWSIDGWWQNILPMRGHSSYVVGNALYYILKAYDTEKRFAGEEHTDWLHFVEHVSDHIEKTKNEQGEYPYLWSEKNGEGILYDSFAGCWCLTVRAYLAILTGKWEMLLSCISSEHWYFDRYVRHMECYGTPMDTYKAVDSEGILAFIRLAVMLHRETGEDVFLIHLRTAMEYEFSFKFCWNVPIQVPPLSRNGWSSSGGSVTSTANHHIHPMSNGVLDELFYLTRQDTDQYYRRRLSDAFTWGLQTYSRFDGEYDFGKKGWMSERFCYSEGLLCEQYPDGSPSSTWFFFLPWGAANLLEGMCGDLCICRPKSAT